MVTIPDAEMADRIGNHLLPEAEPRAERKAAVIMCHCRHCGLWRLNRRRQLCFECYANREIRDRYPSTSIHARRGAGIGRHGSLPTKPTEALPKSEQKIRVMIGRAMRGESLFHPNDGHEQ